MRKFRCPHCGEKSITYADRIAGEFTGSRRNIDLAKRPDIVICKECGG